MRTILIITIIIVGYIKGYSQDTISIKKDTTTFLNRIFVGAEISPSLSYRSLNASDSSTFIKEYRDSSETFRPSYSARISVSYLISKSLMLNAGLGFSDRGYRLNNFNLLDSRYDLHYYYVSIPLNAQYSFSLNKLNVIFKGGFDFGFLLSQNSNLFVKSSDNNIKKYVLKEQNSLNNFNLSLNLGIGIRYNLNNTTGIILSPEYMRSLNTLSDTPVKLYWNSFAVSIGIIKKITP
jgi:hypothetical protein